MTKYNNYSKKNKCIECNKLITNHAIRCMSCKLKILHRNNKNNFKGANNPNFKFKFHYKKLYDLYIKNRKSLSYIAKIYKCSSDTVRRNLKNYKIPRRKTGEGKLGMKIGKYKNRRSYKGKNNPFYGKAHTKQSIEKIQKANLGRIRPLKERIKISIGHGGTGVPYENNKYPYAFFKIRIKILERDNFICQLCFGYGNEVHHIDYNKDNNKKTNLICLCHKCNTRANFNRDYWFACFMYKTNQEIRL